MAWVGAHGDAFRLSAIERVLLAGRAVWFYAAKAVWPAPLVFMYPRWTIDATVWWQYLFPVALAGVIAVLWGVRDRSRGPLAAALFFCGTLFPALGFVNVFPFRYSFVADHFQYLAIIGLLVPLAYGLTIALRRWRPRIQEGLVAGLVAVPLFALTLAQSRQYVSAETLYRSTLAANPDSLLAHNNLAALLLDGPAQRLGRSRAARARGHRHCRRRRGRAQQSGTGVAARGPLRGRRAGAPGGDSPES